MGCSSAKQCKTSSDESKTLLTSTLPKATGAQVAQHHVMSVTLRRGDLSQVVDALSNNDIRQTFASVDGLLDAQILVSAEGKLIVQCRLQSESTVVGVDSKLRSVLKLIVPNLSGEPDKFSAVGGKVQLAGWTIWSLSQLYQVHHEFAEVRAEENIADQLPQLLNSSTVQNALEHFVGLADMKAMLQADGSLHLHARFVSRETFSTQEAAFQEFLSVLSEVSAGQPLRRRATGGSIDLNGRSLWKFPDTSSSETLQAAASSVVDECAGNQQFLGGEGVAMCQDVPEIISVLPEGVETADASRAWLFSYCCTKPCVVHA